VPFVLAVLALAAPASAQIAVTPALQTFAQSVMEDHPALREAQAALESAKAHARGQAQPLYNPELEFGYEDAVSETKEVGISQTFDLGGKRGARADVADAQVAAAQAQLAIARKGLLTSLLMALADYQAASDALDVAKRRVALDQEFLNLADRRNRAGDLPQTELLTARLTLSEARAAASTAAVAFSEAEEALRAIVGVSAPVPELQGNAPQSVPPVNTVTIETLPEMRVASMQAEAARSRISVAKRNRIPDPTVGLSIGDEREFTPLGNRTSTTTYGVRLSIPIPIRNSYGAEVEAAGSDLMVAEQSMRNQRRALEARIAASHSRLSTAIEAWREWQDSGAGSLEEQRRLLQRLWDAGEINAVDYIIQLNQTFATERAGIELRQRLWTTWFDWLGATAQIGEWMEITQ